MALPGGLDEIQIKDWKIQAVAHIQRIYCIVMLADVGKKVQDCLLKNGIRIITPVMLNAVLARKSFGLLRPSPFLGCIFVCCSRDKLFVYFLPSVVVKYLESVQGIQQLP